MKKIFVWSFIAFVCLFCLPKVFPHCQIPCGIYNDEMRFTMMKEHLLTIEKSMKQIIELSEQPDKNANQIVRWVMNKEQHADELAHIVTHYFLSQRIKLVDEKDSTSFKDYLIKVSMLHKMLVYAMKSKQTTDVSNVEKLRSLVQNFHAAYFGK
ncbi:MAG: superoxide dismutase [Candidatus Aminicenantes bacterium]|nr:superoxide dismutase [Candidatus Aminicenantes bacterium]